MTFTVTTPGHLKEAKMDVLPTAYCNLLAKNVSSLFWNQNRLNVREATQMCVGFPQKPISTCYVSLDILDAYVCFRNI